MAEKILIVDDSRTARMFIKQCLQIAGCATCTYFEAGNGKEALEVLGRESGTNLIVTDLNMPEMDGEGLLGALKASGTLKAIPVIVVSSIHNAAKEAELKGKGAFAVLDKPLSPAKMAVILKPLKDAHGGQL